MLSLSACGETYLDLAETAVRAYDGERLEEYTREAETAGVQEHGFPRLAANLGVLVADGRLAGMKPLLKRMLDASCRDAAKGPMPPKSGGNEFSVKELVEAVAALERAKAFPRETTDAWRAALSSVVAERSYSTGRLPLGGARPENWVVFAAASEQSRLKHGMGGDPAFVERYVADQLRWFDENGMYRDAVRNPPAVYDLVTRLQFALLLRDGFDGPSRGSLERLMEKSAEPTLMMLSAAGELPCGGRSNQFLHNHTICSALCEWYAARFAAQGDLRQAARFRRAAAEAVEALGPWLRERPVSHVKNRYPRRAGKEVFSKDCDMGCERYAYFDKYMVTMASWAVLSKLFSDGSRVAAATGPRPAAEVFVTSSHFGYVFLRAGDCSAQLLQTADPHYDCIGLGRFHRRGAPAAICLSTPCTRTPSYRIECANDAPLAICPVGWKGLSVRRAYVADGGAVCESAYGDARWRLALTADGLESTLTGKGAVALTLPAFAFDGRERTLVTVSDKTLTVACCGWKCVYETDGRIVDTGRGACNRNGRYYRFEAHGEGTLAVRVSVVRDGPE